MYIYIYIYTYIYIHTYVVIPKWRNFGHLTKLPTNLVFYPVQDNDLIYPLVITKIAMEELPFIVRFHTKIMIFHSYVSLPMGTSYIIMYVPLSDKRSMLEVFPEVREFSLWHAPLVRGFRTSNPCLGTSGWFLTCYILVKTMHHIFDDLPSGNLT